MSNSKTILFIANNFTALNGMLYVIKQFNENKNVKPVLLCDSCRHYTDQFQVINVGADGTHRNNDAHATVEKRDWYNEGKSTWKHQILVFIETIKIMNIHDSQSRQILNEVKPDAIVIYCDRMKGILQGFLRNAGNIPIIKIPISDTDLEGFSGRYFDKELVVTDKIWTINYIVSKINSGWVRSIDGEKRLFYNAGYIMAGYLKRMISMQPWVSGAGKTTDAIVSCKAEKEAILQRVQKNVIVSGLVEDYGIWDKNKERKEIKAILRETYQIKQSKIIIFSIPQLAEHNLVSWDTHLSNIQFLTDILTREFGHILLSLHPKSKKESYIGLEKYNVSFLCEPLREVINGSDCLIAVSSSSILRWADIVGCEKISISLEELLKPVEREKMSSYQDVRQSGIITDMLPKENLDIKNVIEIITEIIGK